jgi:hypothetical protein
MTLLSWFVNTACFRNKAESNKHVLYFKSHGCHSVQALLLIKQLSLIFFLKNLNLFCFWSDCCPESF